MPTQINLLPRLKPPTIDEIMNKYIEEKETSIPTYGDVISIGG